ncbi:proton-coupled amino acid transporter-like protein pathetic [Pecten maximus]|uniref:proton-coupled amino acid transporter-like protein pathetic n=1 Tax=Pecten maximus TaxID=6579 RepID=UPI001459015B|nr:proton-coupled amino acid transporter-like protein pathetic [Pecten maximus]
MGWLATFNIITLIKCSQSMSKRLNIPSLDYVDLFGYSVSIGPKFTRNFVSESKTIIAVTLTIANIGYCVVYVSMAAAYLEQLMQVYIDGHMFLRPYVLVFCVALLPITLITTLSVLAPFSALGNILNFVNLAIIFQYICRDLPSIKSRPSFTGMSEDRGTMLLAISNLMYSYEGIGSVLPIENRMIEKESYGGWNGLASLAMTISISLYTGFGFFGFLKYGEETQPSILLNLPTDEAFFKAIKVLNIFILYTSVGFQIFVPSKVIWQGIVRRITSGTLIKYGEYLLRFILLLFITLFTMAVPNMDLVRPLVGAMCGSSLAFVFPPLMTAFILWNPDDVEEQSKWKWFKHKLTILFYMVLSLMGVCITIFGTVDAITRIIYRYA